MPEMAARTLHFRLVPRKNQCAIDVLQEAHTYRYYLTRMGRAAIAAACSLIRFNIVPAMAAAH
jgi:hypothetical protein